MVATVGDPVDHAIIHTSKARGAVLTSSYEEEKAARLISDHPVAGILTLPSVTALFDPAGTRPLFF